MDDIAHVLWSIVIYYHYDWWLAALFGVLPDLLAFFPFYARKFMRGKLRRADDVKPNYDINFYSKWVGWLYDATHSIFLVVTIIGACTLAFGYHIEYWAMLIHVLVDVPSHRRQWFGTRLLWPISRWQFNGVSWATREFLLANYTCIALAFSIRLFGL